MFISVVVMVPSREVSKPNFCKHYTLVSITRSPLLNSVRDNEPSGLFSHESKAGLTPNINCRVVASQGSKCASVVIRTIHCDRHCPVVSVTPDKKQMKYDTRPFMRRESQNILGMFRQGRGIFPRHVSAPHKPCCEHFSPPHTVIFHCTIVAKYISLSQHCACEEGSSEHRRQPFKDLF